MKNKSILLVNMFIALLFLMAANVFANETQERIYLTQILNQLNAVKPLIIAASHEQPKTNRLLFHYTAWQDVKKKRRHGLLEDINQIEQGIQQKLSRLPREAGVLPPIQGDYMARPRGQGAW